MTAKKIFPNVLAIFLIISTAAFANEPNKKSPTATDSVYTEDKQNIMVDAKHPQFTLKLKSNPTTGYTWFLREYDASLISPVKHEFQKSDQKLMGAPGYELWTFRVKPAGFVVPHQTTVRMIYARPWQGADNSTQTVFRVTTQEKTN